MADYHFKKWKESGIQEQSLKHEKSKFKKEIKKVKKQVFGKMDEKVVCARPKLEDFDARRLRCFTTMYRPSICCLCHFVGNGFFSTLAHMMCAHPCMLKSITIYGFKGFESVKCFTLPSVNRCTMCKLDCKDHSGFLYHFLGSHVLTAHKLYKRGLAGADNYDISIRFSYDKDREVLLDYWFEIPERHLNPWIGFHIRQLYVPQMNSRLYTELEDIPPENKFTISSSIVFTPVTVLVPSTAIKWCPMPKWT